MAFLLFFLFVFSSLHCIVAARLICYFRASRPRWRWALPMAGWMMLMIAMFPMVRLLEAAGYFDLAKIGYWIGSLWIPVLLWFIALGFVFDIWNLTILVVSRGWRRFAHARISLALQLRAMGGTIALGMVWGLVEAHSTRVVEQDISTHRLPAGTEPIRVAFFADSHIGLIRNANLMRAIVKHIESLDPDLIVAAGDVLDADPGQLGHLAPIFAELEPPLGKYAVLGNHEWYIGARTSLTWLEAAGFRVLRAERDQVTDNLIVAGVDDPAGNHRGDGLTPLLDEDSTLPSAGERANGNGPFVLFLKHQPILEEPSRGRFDLMLAGHTHGGQLFPFNFLVGARYRFLRGRFDVSPESTIYTTTGVGTWGPPMRVFARPEIVLFTIRPSG